MRTVEMLPHAIARGVVIESVLGTKVKADLPYVANAIAASPNHAQVNISPIVRSANYSVSCPENILGMFFIASKTDTQNVSTFSIATTGGLPVANFKIDDSVNEGIVFIPNAIGGTTLSLAEAAGDIFVATSASAQDAELQVGSDLVYPVTGMSNTRITTLPLLADSKFAQRFFDNAAESETPFTDTINGYLDSARGSQISGLYVE